MQELTTPQIFHMAQLKAAITMEMNGMKHSSGRSAYAHAKSIYMIRGNKKKVYTFLTDMLELQKELKDVTAQYDAAFASDNKESLAEAEDAIPAILEKIEELYNANQA